MKWRLIPRAWMTLEKRRALRLKTYHVPDLKRPQSRRECIAGPRPCPWLGCRYNLHLLVTETGGIKLAKTSEGPSCALDVADAGEHEAAFIGELLNLNTHTVYTEINLALDKLARYFGCKQLKPSDLLPGINDKD